MFKIWISESCWLIAVDFYFKCVSHIFIKWKRDFVADSYDISLFFHRNTAATNARSGPANHPAQSRSPAIPITKK